MLTHIINGFSPAYGVLSASFLTVLALFVLYFKFTRPLPTDRGRAFAAQGTLSIGKPTGAGIYFITVYILTSILFIPFSLPIGLTYVLVLFSMLFGFFDDRAEKPWHEYLKGFLDLILSVSAAIVYAVFYGTKIILPVINVRFEMPFVLFVILATLLVWTAINVTNCTDGVDGLSGSMSIVSIASFIILSYLNHIQSDWNYSLIVLIFALLVYLFFNTNPSRILMGDAGSRALGIVLAISALHTGSPFAYLIICLLFIIDGAAGILKISLKRFFGILILKNITTPIHDHYRERASLPNKKYQLKNQTLTARFTIVHMLICLFYLMLVYIVRL